MVKVIFIHGRMQQGKSSEELRKEWTSALDKGLNAAGLEMPENVEFEFPFYGNILDELTKELASQKTKSRDATSIPKVDEFDRFTFEVYEEIAKESGMSNEIEFKELEESETRDRAIQNWKLVNGFVNFVDAHLTPVSRTVIKLFLKDVFYYLTNDRVFEQINEIVSTELDGQDTIFVGHSLGSVVGYNLLLDQSIANSSKGFITLGSPLGINAVVGKLREVRNPLLQSEWFNARDPDDIVALRQLSSPSFNVVPSIENYSEIKNGTDNQHGIAGYLNNPVVAKRLFGAIS